MTKTPIIA